MSKGLNIMNAAASLMANTSSKRRKSANSQTDAKQVRADMDYSIQPKSGMKPAKTLKVKRK